MHLHNAAITVSNSHIIRHSHSFEMFDQTSLQVTTVACLDSCIDETLREVTTTI